MNKLTLKDIRAIIRRLDDNNLNSKFRVAREQLDLIQNYLTHKSEYRPINPWIAFDHLPKEIING